MSEAFVNELLAAVSAELSIEQLGFLRTQIAVVLQRYDVSEKCTELDTWHGQLPECYKAYMVSKSIEGKSPKSLANYKLIIEDMLTRIYKPIADITINDIRAYLFVLQQERGISNRSLDNRRACLASFFSWVSAEGYIPRNPMATFKPIKYEVEERKPLNSLDLERVRTACSTLREKALVEVLYSTACRVTELERLDKSDVDLETGTVRLFGKGSKHRDSYLSPRARLYLQNYLAARDDDNPALFVGSRAPHSRLMKPAIEKIIKQIGATAGIDGLHPHLLRHTAATDLLSRGMSVTELRELLGHSSLDTTMIYAKVSKEAVATNHARYIG